ncbi:outer membrane protein assembly factor BamD, partial [Shewanella sp. 11B5]
MYKIAKGAALVLLSLAITACSSSPEDDDVASKALPCPLYTS